jgi:hypothetical protein
MKMGFDDRWMRIIMSCISTMTYFILVNGQPLGTIYPYRGLR